MILVGVLCICFMQCKSPTVSIDGLYFLLCSAFLLMFIINKLENDGNTEYLDDLEASSAYVNAENHL